MTTQPNILFVFADQWRAQAFGYAGDPNVKTPNIDAFADQSVNVTNFECTHDYQDSYYYFGDDFASAKDIIAREGYTCPQPGRRSSRPDRILRLPLARIVTLTYPSFDGDARH